RAVLETFKLDHAALQATTELSGGQMKLLEAARALMGKAKLLLFDEPAAGVAPALARRVFDHLRRMQQETGMTLLVIEHRLDVLFEYVDYVIVRSEEHTSELQSRENIVCRLQHEKKNNTR